MVLKKVAQDVIVAKYWIGMRPAIIFLQKILPRTLEGGC